MKSCLLGLLALTLVTGCASNNFSAKSSGSRWTTPLRDQQDVVVIKSVLPIGKIKGQYNNGVLEVDFVEFKTADGTQKERLVEVSEGASSVFLDAKECAEIAAATRTVGWDTTAAAPFASRRLSFKSSSGISISHFNKADNYTHRIDVGKDGVIWTDANGLSEFQNLLLKAKEHLEH